MLMSSICIKSSTYNEKKSVGEMAFLEIVFSVLPGEAEPLQVARESGESVTKHSCSLLTYRT